MLFVRRHIRIHIHPRLALGCRSRDRCSAHKLWNQLTTVTANGQLQTYYSNNQLKDYSKSDIA